MLVSSTGVWSGSTCSPPRTSQGTRVAVAPARCIARSRKRRYIHSLQRMLPCAFAALVLHCDTQSWCLCTTLHGSCCACAEYFSLAFFWLHKLGWLDPSTDSATGWGMQQTASIPQLCLELWMVLWCKHLLPADGTEAAMVSRELWRRRIFCLSCAG